MTDQDAGDASQVEPLLNQIDGRIGQFTADGAYDGKPTNDAVTDQGILLECLFPFGWQEAPTCFNGSKWYRREVSLLLGIFGQNIRAAA